jgi:type VI secretion system protein ImpG
MADELLTYYEKELAFIRQLGAEFAREHPKIAGRLGINDDIIEDPHVSRLIEGFAYLNARIQHKLDDDFPELSDSLLNVLFPHYQRPIPSMSIVQFEPNKEVLETPYLIPAKTLLETEQFQGHACRISTVYTTELLPLEVKSASLLGLPITTPGSAKIRGAESVLKLSLGTFTDQINIAELKLNKFRFYLKGQPQYINPLYQMLLNECLNVVLTTSENDTAPVFMGNNVIKPVGFNADEGMLPYPPASFSGYRLLTELFTFPEKFLFVDITELAEHIPKNATTQLHLYIYLRTSDIELEHNINQQSFLMGCTPVVNLFPHKADPIKLEHIRHEYQVIPDAQYPAGYEVYSIDRVSASTQSGDEEDYYPLYGLNHENRDTLTHTYWNASRRNAKLGTFERDEGTDVFLVLSDLDFNPSHPDNRTLAIDTTCSNRDLPAKLPFTSDQPKLQAVHGSPPTTKIRFLLKPTLVIRPPLRNHARWRLISHLNLNYLSLTGRNEATKSLKEILRLYDFKESSVTRALIESISSIRVQAISSPLNIDGRTTMCRGMEIEIEIDDLNLAGSSVFLFATVLEHFFALYCSINTFTRVLVKVKSKEGFLKKCPPRAGEKILL